MNTTTWPEAFLGAAVALAASPGMWIFAGFAGMALIVWAIERGGRP